MKKITNIQEFAKAIKEANQMDSDSMNENDNIELGYKKIDDDYSDKYHSYTAKFPKLVGDEPVVATFTYTSWEEDRPSRLLDLLKVDLHSGSIADLLIAVVKESGGRLERFIEDGVEDYLSNQSEEEESMEGDM